MFRIKPYTQCMRCIKDSARLRCQECMQHIIEDISADYENSKSLKSRRSPKRLFRIRNDLGHQTAHSEMYSQNKANCSLFTRDKHSPSANNLSKNVRTKTSSPFNAENVDSKTAFRVKDCNAPEKLMVTSKYKQWMQ